MRITALAKEQVRRRILDSAGTLLRRGNPDLVNTRELASAAGIAHGTLFNYFPTKEALLVALVAEQLEAARSQLGASANQPRSLEEELFAWIAAELSALAPHRGVAALAFTFALGPALPTDGVAHDFRERTLAIMRTILGKHAPAPSVAVLHLAWSLYLGVLGFWVRDESPHGEDTLSMLDEATRLVGALARGESNRSGV